MSNDSQTLKKLRNRLLTIASEMAMSCELSDDLPTYKYKVGRIDGVFEAVKEIEKLETRSTTEST